MMPPLTTPTPAAAAGDRGYTSIPISAGDVISRSLHNLRTAVSTSLRPWPELISCSGSISRRGSSFSSVLMANLRYFSTNYTIIVCACGALSLIGSPPSLLLFAVLSSLWLLFYFFREDPLLLWGCRLTDRFIFFGLVFLSSIGIWFCWTSLWSLLLGLLSGLSLCVLHALFRDPPFLQQQQQPLIGSGYGSGSYGAVSI